MPRITVRITEETAEWLDQERERLDWSKAKAGGYCINLLQSSSLHINPNQSEVEYVTSKQSDAQHSEVGDLRSELDQLRERIAALEATQPDPDTDGVAEHGDTAASPDTATITPGRDDGESERAALPAADADTVTADWILEHGAWEPHEVTANQARAAALADAYQLIHDQADVTTGMLAGRLAHDDRIGLKESSIRRGLLRVLADLPGIQSPSTGQRKWHYHDDDA